MSHLRSADLFICIFKLKFVGCILGQFIAPAVLFAQVAYEVKDISIPDGVDFISQYGFSEQQEILAKGWSEATQSSDIFLYAGSAWKKLLPPEFEGQPYEIDSLAFSSNGVAAVALYSYSTSESTLFRYKRGRFERIGTFFDRIVAVNKKGDILLDSCKYVKKKKTFSVPLPAGATSIECSAMNDKGVIIGDVWSGASTYGFYFHPKRGGMKKLPLGDGVGMWPRALSNKGHVVAWQYRNVGGSLAIANTKSGVVTVLGSPDAPVVAEIGGINDRGAIVVTSYTDARYQPLLIELNSEPKALLPMMPSDSTIHSFVEVWGGGITKKGALILSGTMVGGEGATIAEKLFLATPKNP